jgi:RimJ/RimL family protein N-acetyltransferase
MVHDYSELADRLERAYSSRIALRRVSLADGWPLFEATRNPLFNKFLMWDTPAGELEVLARIDAIVAAQRRGKMAAMSGVVRSTGEWASLFRFQPYAADPDVMEMGVWTHDRFWQGKYTLEISKMCIDACFASCDVERLVGAAAPDNAGSCQLMRAVGMTDTELVRRRTEGGRRVELQEFEILRSVWTGRAEERAQKPSHEVVPDAAATTAAREAAAHALRDAAREDVQAEPVAD